MTSAFGVIHEIEKAQYLGAYKPTSQLTGAERNDLRSSLKYRKSMRGTLAPIHRRGNSAKLRGALGMTRLAKSDD